MKFAPAHLRLAALAALVTCATAHRTHAEVATRSAPAYPITLLTDTGLDERTLFASADADAPGIARFHEHVRVDVLGPSVRGRVPVRIHGPMPLTGHLADTALVARVRRSGRVPGTPMFVAGNDLVHVLGFASATHATIRAEADESFIEHGRMWADTLNLPAPNDPPRRPIPSGVGLYPIADLGADAVAPSPETSPPGTPGQLRSPATVFDRPGGTRIVDAAYDRGSTCRIVRSRGEFTAMLLGTGPYVAGYVRSSEVEPADPSLFEMRPSRPHPRPWLVTQDDLSGGPYINLRAGTRVGMNGRDITTLRAAGYARVIARGRATAQVAVTINAEVVVFGEVRLDALGTAITED